MTPKWKKAGPNGELEIKFPTGRRFKVEKSLDHNLRHKGEWKVMEYKTGDWEWVDTYSPKGYAKQMAMSLGQYNKQGKKVADYSSSFQYESVMYESADPHPDVVKAYKKTLDAEDKHAEHGTIITKRNVTRASNHLSKKIKQHHSDLDMKGKIALRTKLQNMNEEAMTAADAGIPQDTKNMGPRLSRGIYTRRTGKEINMTDRRRKKNQPPVLLKRFRKYTDG